MIDPVASQLMVFLYTILTGVLIGLFFDVYASIGQIMRLWQKYVWLGDIIYWLLVTVLVYVALLYYNQGEVRFYVLVGLALGGFFYFALNRRQMRRYITKGIIFFILLISKVMMITFFPFKVLYLIITWPFKIVGLILRKILHTLRLLIRKLFINPVKSMGRKIKQSGSRIKNWRRRK